MAGIGFELRKMMGSRSFLGELGALFYAALISSGPWLTSILCLSLLSIYASMQLNKAEAELFRTLAVYSYGASLVLVGTGQLVITRYLADQHYLERHDVTMSCFLTFSLLVLALGTLTGTAAYATLGVSPAYAFWGVVMFLSVCMIWVSMVFIGVIRDYKTILYAFLAGLAVSLGGSILLGSHFGGAGYMAGFGMGQFTIFLVLTARMLTEFDQVGLWDKAALAYFPKLWDLAVIGLCYNAGIWADKAVFWQAPDSRAILDWLRVNDFYDSPTFFAYLTVVPSMAIFLLRVETSFHERYHNYYSLITAKANMSEILAQKALLVEDLRVNLRYLFIVQATVTGICLAFAPTLVSKLGLFPVQVTVFRVVLMGAFLQALVSVVIVILFYFDRRKSVLATVLVFLAGMIGLSWLTVRLGYQYYGYGYAIANLITLAVSFQLLERNLRNLEYNTFAKQPIL
ncbi:hypothetical protein NNJEOMEG_02980 [Fundidesulfovibrio magnetotacticus]|uniref:Transmembrane protein n=1 Tax=Fundidesulfovibrio magnetotacticus TaxID=2730080 RepID=A0A6V8LRL5_9BACT|nr:exopolysaccharide Pel transporter PelG [Fundidesulfovibrio magnetotacticus]GFK95122.1 hypothetical protein NNJEOMEG_02980 [Fundidesulfovibrio magnetotacticus]